MKTNLLITALLSLSMHGLHAQGSLAPPSGPPTATSHTINEVFDKATTIEGQNTAQTTKIDSIQTQITNLGARRPLIAGTPGVNVQASNGTITISEAGSYYLTANKLISTPGAYGIYISSRNVTLDLNGFSVMCVTAGGSAIHLNDNAGTRQVRICNGIIQGNSTWNGATFTAGGWNNGITGAVADVSISDVTINGIKTNGIDCANATVTNCTVSECGAKGINAAVVDKCHVSKCLGTAITAAKSVDHSEGETVSSNWFEHGIDCTDGSVSLCTGIAKSGCGIAAESVSHSRGKSVSGPGIRGGWGSVDYCHGSSTSSVGLEGHSACYSTGTTVSGSAGISVQVASFCSGSHSGGGRAIAAYQIATSCVIIQAGVIYAPTVKQLGTP